jgi:4-diphosphocytidyl-2-C-methyl-D-erythritol kinase
MRRASVDAAAKLNLVLRVGVRDETGYHQLESLFIKLILADRVTVTVDDVTRDELLIDGPAMPLAGLGPVHRNLAWRALDAYRAAGGWPAAARIEIDKQIPVGGGLGGGSADAAAVLRALDALAPSKLGPARLMAIGRTLGADVPFLVSDAALAWSWGRGDRLLTLPPLPSRRVLLIPQEAGVETALAYGWLAQTGSGSARESVAYDVAAFGSWTLLAGVAHNDFAAVVRSRHDGVFRALERLDQVVREARAGGDAEAFALMSGSGATCFGVLDERTPLPNEMAGIVVTRTASDVVGVRLSP